MKPLEYALFLIPFVVGYSTSALCTVGKKAGKTVDFRPPSWVFGVVWPILFGMLGVSWILAYRKDPSLLTLVLYGLTSFSLGLWTVVYGCVGNKKAALSRRIYSQMGMVMTVSVPHHLMHYCFLTVPFSPASLTQALPMSERYAREK